MRAIFSCIFFISRDGKLSELVEAINALKHVGGERSIKAEMNQLEYTFNHEDESGARTSKQVHGVVVYMATGDGTKDEERSNIHFTTYHFIIIISKIIQM